MPESQAPLTNTSPPPPNLLVLMARGAAGGVLMGLANLVPGISGGTMLLAAGVYPRFIEAIGEVTTLRFRREAIAVLASVVLAALLAIILLAGTVKALVIDHRWVMYALFIGLTLGGLPVVWRQIKRSMQPAHPSDTNPPQATMTPIWIGAAIGFVGMAALALLQSSGATGETQRDGFGFLLLAGVAGASAMILPGVSGGYLLLVLGVYVPILSGIDTFKNALPIVGTLHLETILSVGGRVVLPVGLGVVFGVVAVGNLLRWLIQRYERPTLGVLLGLLLGAVVGLWPFQQSIEPSEGQIIKGQVVTRTTLPQPDNPTTPIWVFAESREPVENEDLPTELFTPNALQASAAGGLVLFGFILTLGIDRLQSIGQPQPPNHL